MADFATGADYDEFTRELAGPVASLFVQLSPDTQDRLKNEIASDAGKFGAQSVRGYLGTPQNHALLAH